MTQNFVELLSTVTPQILAPIFRTARQSAERNFMSSIRRRQRQSDYLVTVPSVWLEGDSPTPSTHVVKAWTPPVNIVLAILFGRERDTLSRQSFRLPGTGKWRRQASQNKIGRFSGTTTIRRVFPRLIRFGPVTWIGPRSSTQSSLALRAVLST